VFDTVEVNSTFYRLASRDAVARWVEQTPDGFVFAVKASRYLTHVRRLREIGEGIRRFYERLMPLVESGKLGPVVWQFPASFRNEGDALERVAETLELVPPGRHCFEFRHETWFGEPLYRLLRERGAALVIGDHPKWPFQARELTADWTLVRLHHGRRGRRGNYSERELAVWADAIAAWRRRAEVLVYLNNDWEGFAVENARRLKRRLQPSPAG
jgi:uncharacterized protein YecE (DUF72 family)